YRAVPVIPWVDHDRNTTARLLEQSGKLACDPIEARLSVAWHDHEVAGVGDRDAVEDIKPMMGMVGPDRVRDRSNRRWSVARPDPVDCPGVERDAHDEGATLADIGDVR